MINPRPGPSGRMHASLQLHVSRRCNLQCLHCYSNSSPHQTETLPLDLLQQTVREAVTEGFGHLAISGGEPLLYQPLPKLLKTAKDSGIITTITTNGILLTPQRVAQLQGTVDLIAISLDGVPSSHNHMRNAPRAFESMQANLETLREAQIPFGFIFTLTQYNLHELDWITTFALDQGARSLQIHPLEEFGRASNQLQGNSPDAREKTIAFLEFLRVQAKAKDNLHIQIDLADRVALQAHPDRVYANLTDTDVSTEPLANLVSPLVVETDGTVVPLQYGFPRPYALGNLKERSLLALSNRWKQGGHRPFHTLCSHTFETVTRDNGLPFLNWYEVLAREGRKTTTFPALQR
ncbi:MAG: radical SAM protein [Cyanobacteria bacterium P01_F01_bin.150]